MFIRLADAIVQFPGKNPIRALQEIDLEVQKGEWINILGPSGSGKTTLLNVVGGMQGLTTGSIEVAGKNLSQLSEEDLQSYRREQMGYIFQDYRLFEQYTVLENVMLPQWPYTNKKELKQKATAILEELEMEHRLSAVPGELSGGEKQRTAIARALLNEPDILLCDEPTGNLDGGNRENILHILDDLHQKGITILLVTHDQEIAKWGDHCIQIRDGRIQELAGL